MGDSSEPSIERAIETMALGVEPGGPLEDRRAYLCVGLVDLLAAITGLPTSDIPEEGMLVIESLQATVMSSVLDAAFGVRVPLSTLTAGACIPDLTELLLGATPSDEGHRTLEALAEPATAFSPFDLTDVQQAYLHGRDAGHELGNVDASFYVELDTTGLDVDRFERAMRAAIAAHDMLRAIIRDDGRQQVLADVPDFTVVREDLTGLTESEQQAHLEELRRQATTKRRDVAVWPLFDLYATRMDTERTLLRFGMDLLICDGASFAVLVEELAARYEDPERQIRPLNLTFRDYQRAVTGPEHTARQEQDRAYWSARLDSLPPAPLLPLAGPLSAVDTPRFHRRHHVLSALQWRSLKTRAAAHGLTASTVLAGAYADVLARWSESGDFTVNVTVNNRKPVHEQVKQVIGDFTTLTLLDIRCDGERTFSQRVAALQTQLWQDLDHSAYSGIRVMRELARRSGPASAVSPVVFSTFVGSGFSDDFDPDWLRGINYTLAQAPQLTLECLTLEFRGELHLTWDSVDDAFAPGLLDDMFHAYRTLLEELAQSETAWDQQVTAVTPTRQLAVRQKINQTQKPTPDALLHRLGTALKQRGSQPAVITEEVTLSYGELDSRACRIGRGLRRAGARPNQLVAVVMEKGWEQAVGALAVLYSGAAYLPIDATLPPDRIHRLLALGEVDLVLTQTPVRDRLEWPEHLTVLDVSDVRCWSHEADGPLDDVQQSTDLAYVIFTSGSTGEPKGVMIDHRGAANTCWDINTRFAVGPNDRVLGLSSLSFDLSVWDLFGIFAAGGTLVLPEQDAGRDPERWAQLVIQHQVTVWNTVPALMQMYTTYAEAQPARHVLEPLRLVLMSGDWIEVTLADRIRAQKSTSVDIISLGGATEASIWSIHHRIHAPTPGWKSIPYGTPLTNQTFHVLDDQLQPCPDWVTGRLFIGGTGLARGYWNDSARTQQQFVTNPHTGESLYDTGDRGRYHPDGTIEFLGRDDGQVKVNGYRIELGEIEHTLSSHDRIQQAVALTTGNQILAFVTPHADSALDGGAEARAQVADWQEIFDSLRAEPSAQIAGWTDSFTGQMIDDQDMADWADLTASRILAHRPRRVLEIGCGAGLIATRLLPECAQYVGTDLSALTLDDLARRLEHEGLADRATLLHREATDLTGIEPSHFDVVVINSVAQYFPSADYLLHTVRQALSALRPGGVVYLGDVRDLRQLRSFHVAIERSQAGTNEVVRDLAWRLQQRELTEAELVVAPELFWSQLNTPATVLPRPGAGHTEMADYRYDVVVFTDTGVADSLPSALTWTDAAHTVSVLKELLGCRQETVRLQAVPNERLQRDAAWAHGLSDPAAAGLTLAEFGATVWPQSETAVSLTSEQLLDLAHEHGYTCEFFYLPDSTPHTFDAVFTATPHAAEAAVRAYACTRPDPSADQTYANDPVRARQTASLPAELLLHARTVLPSYMVPSDVFVLATLPLTGNGKVDTARLHEIATRNRPSSAARPDAHPSNPLEQALATAWQQVLGLAEVSVHDDFFRIGGDSLLAVQLVRAVGRAGLAVTVAEVFANPTIATLAHVLSSRDTQDHGVFTAGEETRIVSAPEDRFTPFPLTDLQQAYLLGRNGFFDLGNVAASFYVELSVDDLDAERLSAALTRMVERHDMLRAVIGRDGQWHVQPHAAPYAVAVRDLRALDPEVAEAELDRVRRECSTTIFDPAKAPLFDVRISQLDGSSRLHISLDLLIADGGTVAVFLTELASRYSEPDHHWPPLELTFRDYQQALAEAENSPRYERARAYWTARAQDLPAGPRLPLAADPADVSEPHFARHTHRLPADTWQALKDKAAQHGITPSAALATAYTETLHAFSDAATFTLNVTVNKRLPLHEQIAEVIGDFTATSLLAVSHEPTATFAARAGTLQTQLAHDLDHNEFTGIKVLRELARLHGPERATIPVVFTSALDSKSADFAQAAHGLGAMVDSIVHTPQVHIDHQVFEYDGDLVLNWDFIEELFDVADIDQMFQTYTELVTRLATHDSAWQQAPMAPAALPAQRCHPTRSDSATGHPLPASDVTDATQRILTRIWADILRLDTVPLTTDFTHLGGDSLLAMQVIAQAAAAGLEISPRDFFAHQTVAALATIARPAAPDTRSPREGDTVLLPRQQILLEEWKHPQEHNYVLLFDLAEPMDKTALRVALRTLLRHHEALRLSITATASGHTGHIAGMDTLETPLTWVEPTGLTEEEVAQTIRDTSLSLQSSIDIGAAPLIRVAALQQRGRQQLLIVINQLICDNYSCRILCEDLVSAYQQVSATGEAVLPPSDSLAAWSELVRSQADSPEVRSELTYWQRLEHLPAPLAIADPLPGEPALIALDEEASAALMETATVPDLLLAAVTRVIARRTGAGTVRVDLDSHGRDVPSITLNPARIVGRLATRWPLDIPDLTELSLHEAAAAVGARRDKAPAAGDHYELLATSGHEHTLHPAPARVLFNYLGHSDALWERLGLTLSPDHPGILPNADRQSRRLEFVAGFFSGRLVLASLSGAPDLLHAIGRDLTVGLLGHTAPLTVPADLDVLRHWLAH